MTQSKGELIIKENIIKNLIIVILAFLFYPNLQNALSDIPPEATSDLLLIISILLVTVSFASFAFTYEKINLKSIGSRILAHSATFLFLLITALLLEVMVIAIGLAYPPLFTIAIVFSILLYMSIILYDFWDLFRLQ
ncbi:hypothetical protein HN748_00380 [Candidatus Peregrinibacteria bacterium]|jgi:hypothetical protein|nr:hypothetical protein [Candidatus Peregrinibacteria bacterium]MBT7483439.1 hypothetical protein [Candidatus Peregrinibacteria bacterium]MBT7702669.1 hypothetical protein [Candidatus Peregrinibacteria bacterium]